MHVHDIRRQNLRTLIEQWGGPTALAIRLGFTTGSYLAQLAGPNPTRVVGERAARSIEAQLRLTPGWLDRQRQQWADGVEAALLADCIHVLAEASQDLPEPLPAAKQADLVAVAFEVARQAGHVDRMLVRRLVRLGRV